MKIRIPKEKFDRIKSLIEHAKKYNCEGIILDNKNNTFERYPKRKTLLDS